MGRKSLQGAEWILARGRQLMGDRPELSILRHFFLTDWTVMGDPGNRGLAALLAGRPGAELYAMTGDGHLYVWSPYSRALVFSNKVSAGACPSLPLGTTTGKFGLIEDWSRISTVDLQTNQKETITEHALISAPNSLAPSADGRLLACRTSGGEIHIWDSVAARVQARVRGPQADRVLLALSPDGRFLATGTSDGIAQAWDAATGQPITGPLVGHLAELVKVSFSADGKSLVTYCADYTAKIWNVATGREMMSGVPLNNFLVYHPWWHLLAEDGNSVVESAGERAIRVVRLPTLSQIDALDQAQPDARRENP